MRPGRTTAPAEVGMSDAEEAVNGDSGIAVSLVRVGGFRGTGEVSSQDRADSPK